MTAYRTIVLEHFRRPRNRSALPDANREAEGVNALCGDRIRVQLRLDAETIAEARFAADACALCIASASLLTERVRGMRAADALALDGRSMEGLLGGAPPPARGRCAMLPLETLQWAVRAGGSVARGG